MLGRTLIALSQHFVISVSTTGGQPCSIEFYKIVEYFLCLQIYFGLTLIRGGRWSVWMAHSTRRSLPPISSKGNLLASTSHRMMPQLGRIKY